MSRPALWPSQMIEASRVSRYFCAVYTNLLALRRAAEELANDAEEVVQAVVVEPVPGAVEADDGGVAEDLRPAVLDGVAGLALPAPQGRGGAADPRPEELDVPAAHVVGRPGAHVVVELPAVRPVLVLVDAVGRQVARLLRREVRVLLLHAAERVLDGGIPPRKPASEATLLADPLVHALGDRPGGALGQHAGRGAEPLDHDQPGHVRGVDPGVAQRDVAAQGVRDDRHRRQPLLVDELREIVDVAGHRVAAVGGPPTGPPAPPRSARWGGGG